MAFASGECVGREKTGLCAPTSPEMGENAVLYNRRLWVEILIAQAWGNTVLLNVPKTHHILMLEVSVKRTEDELPHTPFVVSCCCDSL